jgi:hypothetical protein
MSRSINLTHPLAYSHGCYSILLCSTNRTFIPRLPWWLRWRIRALAMR